MIVAVVRDEYAPNLLERLQQQRFQATKLASTGGFLRAGNSTFLIGVPSEQIDSALACIEAVCPKGQAPNAGPGGVTVGGATVFVLDVEKMVKV
jgi:uncharacterized protein YaaQ